MLKKTMLGVFDVGHDNSYEVILRHCHDCDFNGPSVFRLVDGDVVRVSGGYSFGDI